MTSRILALLILGLPALAQAATTCTFTSTPGMAFGAYDDSSPLPTNGTTAIIVRCSRVGGPSSVDVTLQVGPSANSGSIAAREMRSGANPMNYNLYRDIARSLVWGQTTGADTVTIKISGIPNNGSANGTFTLYGRIPALENAPAGAYSDSVQLTVSP